jgi:hypothetical protein
MKVAKNILKNCLFVMGVVLMTAALPIYGAETSSTDSEHVVGRPPEGAPRTAMAILAQEREAREKAAREGSTAAKASAPAGDFARPRLYAELAGPDAVAQAELIRKAQEARRQAALVTGGAIAPAPAVHLAFPLPLAERADSAAVAEDLRRREDAKKGMCVQLSLLDEAIKGLQTAFPASVVFPAECVMSVACEEALLAAIRAITMAQCCYVTPNQMPSAVATVFEDLCRLLWSIFSRTDVVCNQDRGLYKAIFAMTKSYARWHGLPWNPPAVVIVQPGVIHDWVMADLLSQKQCYQDQISGWMAEDQVDQELADREIARLSSQLQNIDQQLALMSQGHWVGGAAEVLVRESERHYGAGAGSGSCHGGGRRL